jgi:hypothetical protein
VRFTWFNLMPWPYLPEDFRQRNRSVWVDIPSSLYDPKKGHFLYHEYMDQLEYADALGFDGIGVNEHHQNGYGLMPSVEGLRRAAPRGREAPCDRQADRGVAEHKADQGDRDQGCVHGGLRGWEVRTVRAHPRARPLAVLKPVLFAFSHRFHHERRT